MIDQLVMDMKNQMNIKRFIIESEVEFNRRIVYSAASAWLKELTNSKSYTSIADENTQGVEYQHVKYHLTKVLTALTTCLDIGNRWDKNIDKEVFAKSFASYVMRKGLEYPYNLGYIGDGNHIMVALPQLIPMGNFYLLRGQTNNSSDFFYTGLCQWSRTRLDYEIDDKFNPAFASVDQVYRSLLTDIKWKEIGLSGKYSYYIPGKNDKVELSWSYYNSKKILSDGVYLFKENNHYYGYFIIKQENNQLFGAQLDPWYITNGEISRICYSLDYKAGVSRTVLVTIKDDFVILKLFNKLPDWERHLLVASSWPFKTYDDEWERIIPIELWDNVKIWIKRLGLSIQERDGIRDGRNWHSENTR